MPDAFKIFIFVVIFAGAGLTAAYFADKHEFAKGAGTYKLSSGEIVTCQQRKIDNCGFSFWDCLNNNEYHCQDGFQKLK